jgi:hypothetical protein
VAPAYRVQEHCVKNPDWTVFSPVLVRISKLMRDGKTRSVADVCKALELASNCHARKLLRSLSAKGVLAEGYEKRDRHCVLCYKLAPRAGRVRRKAVPALGR